jgi:hypothetical protein
VTFSFIAMIADAKKTEAILLYGLRGLIVTNVKIIRKTKNRPVIMLMLYYLI